MSILLMAFTMGLVSCVSEDEPTPDDQISEADQISEGELLSELICTVDEFADKYKSLKKGELVSLTISDVSNDNISSLAAVLKLMSGNAISKTGTDGYIVELVLESQKSLTVIPEYAFARCNALVSITLPEGVVSIEQGAFGDCINLKDISIPSSLRTIKGRVFYSCEKLASIIIPDGVVEIGEEAFKYCRSLNNVEIPNSLKRIENCAFFDCGGISELKLPDDLEFVGFSAFEGTSIESLDIDCWGIYNFYNGRLIAVRIPEGITRIEDRCFDHCVNLDWIALPESVTEIGDKAFVACSNLSLIWCSQALYDKYHDIYPQLKVMDDSLL